MRNENKILKGEEIGSKFVTKQTTKQNKQKTKKKTVVKYFRTHSEISSDANFLRNLRLELDMNRTIASKVLSMSVSSLKRYETGISHLTTAKIDHFLKNYCISHVDYMKYKAGEEIPISRIEIIKQPKVIENNPLRRSYRKKITKEVKALIHLRKIKKINQYELTELCGWNRTAINHIENGRIELSQEKLKHILNCLGFTLKKFNQYLDESINRISIEKKCIQKIIELESKKLISLETILENF